MVRRPLRPDRIPGDAIAPRLAFIARHGDSPMESGSVVYVPVDARPLLTIGPDSDVWNGEPNEGYEGAIVRIFPPPGVDPTRLLRFEEVLRSVGAVVRTMPAAPEDRVLVEGPAVDESHADTQSIREVVYEMVTVARTANRDLLVDVVEEALCAAGL